MTKTYLAGIFLSLFIFMSSCTETGFDNLDDDTTTTDTTTTTTPEEPETPEPETPEPETPEPEEPETPEPDDPSNPYPDWSDNTHSKSVDPNYDIVFAQNTVLRVDLTISAENWDAMWADLGDNLGFTTNPGGGFPGDFPGGGPGGNPGGGGGMTNVDFDPIWVPCRFTFDNTDWYEVGVRFKGNSSLSSAYSSGIDKLSLKFDFDQFEDDFPELKNQRFHGFKQLNFNNNYNDQSLMREKVTADLFRAFGIPAAHTTFCLVYIDYGSGSEYYGVYTIVEEVDDTVIETQFTDDSGNLYKPEDDAATFAQGTFDEEEFNVKTNESSCDFSDVRALYDALHDSSRTSDIEAWKTQLESILNVDHFLKWLAANIVIQNWDTYGNMSHNYYIYTNPADGLITWIPWDNNEALQTGHTALSPNLSSVSSQWPLISYLIAVPEYEAIYEGYLRDFIDQVFIPSDMIATYSSYYTLLKEHAYAEENGRTFITSDSQFDSAVSSLKSHVQSRNTTIENYLN